MTYLDLINRFWRLNRQYNFSAHETQLYFKLLDTCNVLGWPDSFSQSNRYICGETGLAERTMLDVRVRLQKFGLIEFIPGSYRTVLTNYRIVHDDGAGYRKPGYLPVKVYTPIHENPATSIRTIPDKEQDADKDLEKEEDQETDQEPEQETRSASSTVVDDRSPSVFSFGNKINKKKEKKGAIVAEEKPAEWSAENVMEFYNRQCGRMPKALTLTRTRKKMVLARLKEHGGDRVRQVLEKAAASDFLCGTNSKGWRAGFDWLLHPSNFLKILEGTYSNPSQANDRSATTEGSQQSGFRESENKKEKTSCYDMLEEALQHSLQTL